MGAEPKSRGELGEIRTTLAALAQSGAAKSDTVQASKRDVFRKIVNYMTIGIDMSSLFMQVMTCAVSSGEDIILRKMLYLYISTYSQSNPELTLLTINLLTKDCRDQDPTIRGLALRSLCQLRVADLLEYTMSPVQQGLKDAHPYVRRTAVMGVLKLYQTDAAAVRHAGLLEVLQEMLLKDGDTQVVANCMTVLQQAGALESLITRTLVITLLNRIKDFSEWAQCLVLEALSVYRPGGEEHVYDIMNVLDDRLSHSNSAVVMATVKLFLHLTLAMPATHQQVLLRVRDPLQTLLSRDHYETAYAVLCHFLLLAQRAPSIFADIYTTFYCRQNEPSYIKGLKLEILATIADQSNAHDIASELTEYVGDVDEQLARDAVRAVGKIALEVQDVSGIVERLLGFLELGKPAVTAEAVSCIKDLLRRYPTAADACLGAISAVSPDDVEEPEARAAFVWILGEYGHSIQDAPYLLEGLASTFASEAAVVRLALLTAATKLFFRRAPECQLLLGSVLAAGAGESDPDVHDRALLYYRLLESDVAGAQRVVGTPLAPLGAFAEEQSAELRDRIFDEFNSVAVVYRAPASTFLVEAPLAPDVLEEEGGAGGLVGGGVGPSNGNSAPAGFVDEGSSLLSEQEQEVALIDTASSSPNASAPATPAPQPPPTSNGGLIPGLDDIFSAPAPQPLQPAALNQQPQAPLSQQVDLLALDDFFGPTPSNAPLGAPPTPPPPAGLQLAAKPQLTPAEFQAKWGALASASRFTHTLSHAALALIGADKHKEFIARAGAKGVATMASGGSAPLFRFYFHAQPVGSTAHLLAEVLVFMAAGNANVTVKSEAPPETEPFCDLLKGVFKSLD